MDEIRISNLEVFGHHGVFAEENTLGQKFLVSAVLYTDTRRAGQTDQLEYSIHYGDVCHTIKQIMEEQNYKLLETVAETIADRLLKKYDLLERIQIEIKKPWAPIKLPIDTVAVRIERGWHTVYLGLGSNMGDKQAYLDQAVQTIRDDGDFKDISVSSYIQTKPYGYQEQEDFLNGCLECKTVLSPEQLLVRIHAIEQAAGRTREIHWGPRTLDIDILFYDREVIETKNLCIPHPEIPMRGFVLEPLSELAPYYHHPIFGMTVLEMRRVLAEQERKFQS